MTAVGITPRHRDRIPLAIRLGILYPQAYPGTKQTNPLVFSMTYSPTKTTLPLPDFLYISMSVRPCKANLFNVPPLYEIAP
jgi:hypothetical protein